MVAFGRQGMESFELQGQYNFIYKMALLTAGKQISVGANNGFGRGLFPVDPEEAEREANKKMNYKEELRIQMEEQRRKKEEQKRKDMQYDMRLEAKFNEEKQKQAQKKNEKPPQRNDKNLPPPIQKSHVLRTEFPREEPLRREEPEFKFNFRSNTEEDHPAPNPYLQRPANLAQMQEEQFFDDTNTQKIRAMRESLQEKMNEVYRKIQQSRDLQVDKELELIRKKINSSNAGYESQNPKVEQFQHEFSHFYKVPKKNVYEDNNIKNLNYESRAEVNRKQFTPQRQQYAPPAPQQEDPMPVSRNNYSRESEVQNQWGRKRGKNNFLGNREAADFQIESIANNIDNILSNHS